MKHILTILALPMSLILLAVVSAWPQMPAPCFSIHVWVDGKSVESPKSIILKATNTEQSMMLDGGCFHIPANVLNQQAVDVIFTVPGNKIHLAAVAPGFFAGSWDAELEDERFGKDVVLPKHARVKEACAVVFHVGEPETAIAQTHCRTPF